MRVGGDFGPEGQRYRGRGWQFWIDVGGTFTDCIACSPEGELTATKVLSSSALKGRPGEGSSPAEIVDPDRRGPKKDFFSGYELVLLSRAGRALESRRVAASDSDRGALRVETPCERLSECAAYELRSPEEAPLLAIRSMLDLRLDEPIGPIELRLGATRGTNALLERKGARTALVTTEGFGDVLRIGYQDRPSLFDLAIRKPLPLFERVVEVRERTGAGGEVLAALDEDDARAKLEATAREGIEAVAVCLLHALRNPYHEERLGEIAREAGFSSIALSSRASAAVKMVPRGDTTVVDAYLAPVIDAYVESLRRAAPDATLRLLASSGGLAAPESFRGSESILSGPAGGVVGAARAAERAGFSRAIAVDMGGTSTDTSRYDGRFELEFEKEKAGVRIAQPLLAIETVAAGGGSICRFDGERLLVGPASAGARPGPAGYGGGGPLTLTDVNLFLGRIPEERFPFPLDRDAVAARTEEIRREVERSGHPRSAIEIAQGFLEIANARMAQAIRKVSVSRGYDTRDYVLVAFGGAGPQHACAIARELGMRTVLVPAMAGILSAFGAGLAGARKLIEKPVLAALAPASESALGPLFSSMEAEVRAQAAAEGVSSEDVERPERYVELRYRGQDATLSIAAGAPGLRERFESEHRRLYGYVHAERPIEIVSAWVELTGRSRESERDLAVKESPALATHERTHHAVFEGREVATPLVDQSALEAGRRIAGPAIIVSPCHTTVVEPGWEARVRQGGDLLLETARRGGRRPRRDSRAAALDPVRLEIFHRRFAAIAEEMGLVLRRSAFSTNIRERLDFSCAIFDRDGGIVANAPHIPVHLGALSDAIRHIARDVPDLSAGDVVVTNDPFRGGSHLPDITVVTPVSAPASEEILFYVASRAHHAEIGGLLPGSMSPRSRNLEEEGVLIRSFRVIEKGRPRFDALRSILESARFPSRSPEENLADIEAQIAANRGGADRILRLIESYGVETVLSYMDHIQSAARRLMERRLAALPRGDFTFADSLDDGSPLRVTVKVRGKSAIIDFTGTGPVHPGNLNATPAIVSSAVLYSFRCLLSDDIPLNSGVLAPLRIVLPECFLNPPPRERPSECAAVSGGNVETSQRIVDVLFGALGTVAASQGTMNNLLFGSRSFSYYETIAGGAGAGPDFDGADAVHTHMTNTRITDPEVLESRYPVRLRRFSIRRGSGGGGARRGGDGVIRELEFLAELEVSIVSQRRTRPPYGLAGGLPGACGRNLLRERGKETWRELPPVASFTAHPGDVLRIETPGGGGYGPPDARDVASSSKRPM